MRPMRQETVEITAQFFQGEIWLSYENQMWVA